MVSMARRRSAFRSGGFSLVEALIVMLVLGILMAVAVPSLAETMGRQRGRGAVEGLRAAMQAAKGEAVKESSNFFVSVTTGSGWCYAVSRGQGCGCSTSCDPAGDLIQKVEGGEFPGTTVVSASFAGSLCGSTECARFEPTRGTAQGSNGTVVVESATGARYRVLLSTLGRVRVCVASGDSASPWPACG